MFEAYLTSVFFPGAGRDISLRNRDELRTLAAAVDHIMRGDTLKAAEMLVCRFQAVETSHVDGSWQFARHLTALGESAVSSVTSEERAKAVRAEQRELRLKALAQGLGPRKDAAG